MSRTVEQLTTAPTADELFDQMILWLVNQGLPADKWRPNGVARSILRAVATVFVLLAGVITLVNGGGFLETARGDFLTLLARYVYGVERVTATFASGTANLTNSGGGVYTWQPGELVIRNSVTRKLYRNTLIFSLNPGETDKPCTVEALEIGTASNAGSGQVTELAITAAGVTVTNPAPIVGIDDQLDDALRAECLARLGALSMLGPRGAYAYAVQSAKNAGVPVSVNRWVISPASSNGTVSIRVASPSGPATVGDVAAIKTRIEEVARPDVVKVDLDTVSTLTYTATLTVWARFSEGLTEDAIRVPVLAALADYGARYAIGGIRKPPSISSKLYDESVRGVAQLAHPAIYAVDSTGTDLTLAFGQVAVLAIVLDVRLVTTGATS